MSPTLRRILYVLSFEACGILVGGAVLWLLSRSDPASSGTLAVFCSLVAVAWSFVYNTGFEAWEARRARGGRGVVLRIGHVLGLEAGLIIFLVPLIAWWLSAPLWQALVYDLSMSGVFLAYAFLFNLGFDAVFGLPRSARRQPG